MTRSMWAIIQVDSFDEGYNPRWLVRSWKNSPFEQLIGTVSRTDKRKTFLNVPILWCCCQSLCSVNSSLCLIPRPSSLNDRRFTVGLVLTLQTKRSWKANRTFHQKSSFRKRFELVWFWRWRFTPFDVFVQTIFWSILVTTPSTVHVI